jgi:hypothetical protein
MRFSNKMASLTGDVAFRQSSMAQMQPGKYIAFAAEKNGVALWNNNEFVKLLESEGPDLSLHENERATVRRTSAVGRRRAHGRLLPSRQDVALVIESFVFTRTAGPL